MPFQHAADHFYDPGERKFAGQEAPQAAVERQAARDALQQRLVGDEVTVGEVAGAWQ